MDDVPNGNEVIHTSLNGIYWRVGEGTHRARNEADEHVLIRGQDVQFRLHALRELLQFLVRSEVGACIRIPFRCSSISNTKHRATRQSKYPRIRSVE